VQSAGPATATPQELADGGLAGATARGEAASVQWVKDGLVVLGEQLANACGFTFSRAKAAERGDVFAVNIGNRLYYPDRSWSWIAKPWPWCAERSGPRRPSR
jgi:hypothetical protein